MVRVALEAVGVASALGAVGALLYIFAHGLTAPTYTASFLGWWDASFDIVMTLPGLAWVLYRLARLLWRPGEDRDI